MQKFETIRQPLLWFWITVVTTTRRKMYLISAHADGGPRSRVRARETLRSAPHRHEQKFSGTRFCRVTFKIFEKFEGDCRNVCRKISAHVDGGLSGGSRVSRPGSEDPHRRERKCYLKKLSHFNYTNYFIIESNFIFTILQCLQTN